jgi:hypothetical protein
MSYLADLARFSRYEELLAELAYDPSRINEQNEVKLCVFVNKKIFLSKEV